LISKLKSEISEKDNALGRNYNDNDHEIQVLKQQVEVKKQENAQLSSTIRDLRVSLKDAESEGERKRRDLVERCNFMEGEARKYKE
jgi:chromosome segregation ATPase